MKRQPKKLKSLGHRKEEIVAAAGAVAGAGLGAVAGPPGIVAGAIIGGAIGAVVGHQLETDDAAASAHDMVLDKEIGVEGGDMGAASPSQPRPVRGAYSGSSAGVTSGGGTTPAEGPMQNTDDD